MNCPDCDDRLIPVDTGEPDYELIEGLWWCQTCQCEYDEAAGDFDEAAGDFDGEQV